MGFFKNKTVAIILAVILVIASTLLATHVKLGNKVNDITEGFYNGINYDGYLHPSVFTQLKNISSSCLGISTIAMEYGIDTTSLNDARSHLETNLDGKEGNIKELYANYSDLTAVATQVINELKTKTLNERDQTGFSQYLTNYDGAIATIESSGYNESVSTFINGSYHSFPANILAKLSGVKAPAYFA